MIGKCKDCEFCIQTRTEFLEKPTPPKPKERKSWWTGTIYKDYNSSSLDNLFYYIELERYYNDIQRVHFCVVFPEHTWHPAGHGCGQYKLKDGIILE